MITEGEWKYLRSKKKHKDDLFIYTDAIDLPEGFIGKTYGFGPHDEEANAKLIAASKLLLEACKDALNLMAATKYIEYEDDADYNIGETEHQLQVAIESATQ